MDTFKDNNKYFLLSQAVGSALVNIFYYISGAVLPLGLFACYIFLSSSVAVRTVEVLITKDHVSKSVCILLTLTGVGILLMYQPWSSGSHDLHFKIDDKTFINLNVTINGNDPFMGHLKNESSTRKIQSFTNNFLNLPFQNSSLKILNQSIILFKYRDKVSVKENQSTPTDIQNIKILGNTNVNYKVGLIFATFCAVIRGLNFGLFRGTSLKDIDLTLQLLMMCIVGSFLSITLMLIFEIHYLVIPDRMDITYATIHAIVVSIHQLTALNAIRYIPATIFILVSTLDLILSLVAQHTILSGILPGHGNLLEVVGGVITILSAIAGSVLAVVQAEK